MSKKTSESTIAEMTGHAFLADINPRHIEFSSTNEQLRDPSEISEEGIKELADSIAQKGLLQPILLRPKGNGNFILVAGERRLRACILLGMESVPAYVKDMTEEEAFELQITENLQRKDVHPMKEAKAFSYLQGKHNHTTADLALRFGKSETYVLQRLRLLSLLPDIQKDFAAGDLNLAQALVIARLEKADQKTIIEGCKNENGKLDNGRNYYYSVQELEHYIANEITRELKAAPWDLNDAQLVPKAGACSTCGKRSGAQGKLFADIKEKDRCFDSACFASKSGAQVLIQVKKLVEEKPDTIFLQGRDGTYQPGRTGPDQRVASFLSSQKIKPLVEYESFSPNDYHSQFKKVVQGFYINGPKAGKFSKVYVAGPATKSVQASSASGEQKVTAEDIKASIERIKERTKRAAELDGEKVYGRVIEAALKHDALKRGKVSYTPADIALMAGLISEFTNYSEDLKAFGLKKSIWGDDKGHVKQADALERLTQYDCAEMARHVALHCRESYHLPQKHKEVIGVLITRAARSWGIPVEQFEKEQADERKLREERAAKRIKELQAQLKPADEKGGKKK